MFSLWNTTTKRQSFHHLHTVEEQQNRDENVVALIVFQVLHDPSSRFGHCLRPAKARTLEKFRPRFHLWFSLVEPFFSELYVWGRSYSGSHFDISTDFVRRHFSTTSPLLLSISPTGTNHILSGGTTGMILSARPVCTEVWMTNK